jgi:hypothetical protein
VPSAVVVVHDDHVDLIAMVVFEFELNLLKYDV